MTVAHAEINRIKEVYELRKLHVPSERYSYFSPAHLFNSQSFEMEFLELLVRHKMTSLANKKILDVGCGNGEALRNLIRYGASPENLYGIDLLSDRIDLARKLAPNIDFRCVEASSLPFKDESFDMVMQFTVFTSILDHQMRRRVAAEMLRVLKPDGLIIWYDYFVNNPNNPNVRAVKKPEIFELFPGCQISLKRVTLAPPITRALTPRSWMTSYLLQKVRVLNTHYLGGIRKETRIK